MARALPIFFKLSHVFNFWPRPGRVWPMGSPGPGPSQAWAAYGQGLAQYFLNVANIFYFGRRVKESKSISNIFLQPYKPDLHACGVVTNTNTNTNLTYMHAE